ncbi:MAG: glycosyltransferase [Anaerolineales bacterium]|nr:glycosyltransferase [Anaerolineales bacterium]
MSKPRVAMVSLSPLATGGIETHLLQIFHGLGREFDFRVIGTVAEPFPTLAGGAGVKCVPLPAAGKLDPRGLLRLWKEFHAQKIDLVHTHDTRGGWLGRLAARLAGIPAIHTVHTPSFFLPPNPLAVFAYRQAERVLNNRFSDEVIFVSKTIRKMYLDGRLAAAEKSSHVANGLEAEWFSSAQHILRPGAEIRYLYVGRMAREKGMENLAAAFGTVAKKVRGARLLIAGEGPKRADLVRAAESGGWRANLELLGLLLRAKAREAMRAADVFVLPSDFESFSYTLLEAMASGLPCIAADVGGNRDLVEPERTGLLVPRGDPYRLAEAMIRLSDNPEMRIAMGREGALRAQEYTLERMIDGTRSVYRAVLDRRSTGGTST